MLLVIDVGNTNTVLGIYAEDALRGQFRISTNRHSTADEVGTLMVQILERHGFAPADLEAVVLASVVPQLNRALSGACTRYLGVTPAIIGTDVPYGIELGVDAPHEVGADRVVNAVAGHAQFQQGLIIIDFGTATTIDVVAPDGAYLGGAIAPGIGISTEALFQAASKLPRIEVREPAHAIGKNTVDAMRSGLFFGYVGLIDELVRRMRAELDFPTRVLATGGLATVFQDASSTIESVLPEMTLEGLRLIYERHVALRADA